jgi:peptidyl-tRNA hydrolase
MDEDRIKMYCIFAKESLTKMNGIRGKLAAQAGHAYLHSYWDAENRFGEDAYPINFGSMAEFPLGSGHRIYKYQDAIVQYRKGPRAYKICLVVDTVEQLKEIEAEYREICGVSLVTDAGFTVFDEPTTTCLGIGPLLDSEKTETLSKLKTLT